HSPSLYSNRGAPCQDRIAAAGICEGAVSPPGPVSGSRSGSRGRRRLLAPTARFVTALRRCQRFVVFSALLESALGDGVEARAVAVEVLLPALAVPQFEMVPDTDQGHLVLQSRELE